MSKIVLSHIDKFYGDNHVLRDINLTIEDGDFMTLLGPSGCGKTTTLRVVSGLEKPQHGTMTMDDRMIIDADKAFYEDGQIRNLYETYVTETDIVQTQHGDNNDYVMGCHTVENDLYIS